MAGGFFITELCLIYHCISHSLAFHQGTHFTTNEVWQWANASGVHWSNNVLHHTKQLSINMCVSVYGGTVFPDGSAGKESAWNAGAAGDVSSTPG